MNKRGIISKSLVIAIITASAACILSLITLLIRGFDDNILLSKNEADATEENVSAELSATPDYGQNYIDNIIFLCDSTMADITNYNVLSECRAAVQIWTDEKRAMALEYTVDCTTIVYPETGELMSAAEAAALKRPSYIVITLGINNGVPHCSEESFKQYYTKLINLKYKHEPTRRTHKTHSFQ